MTKNGQNPLNKSNKDLPNFLTSSGGVQADSLQRYSAETVAEVKEKSVDHRHGTPKNSSSIGTEPRSCTKPCLTAGDFTFTPSMSYGEKLLLQKSRRDELFPKVKPESQIECDATDELIESAKGEFFVNSVLCVTNLAEDWKMQDEPDLETLYRLSQISGDQILSSCNSDSNCLPVVKPFHGANELTEDKILQNTKQTSAKEDQSPFDVGKDEWCLADIEEEIDAQRTLDVIREYLRDLPETEGDGDSDKNSGYNVKSGGACYSRKS
uniref:Expressed conserved protein n=1 Tax=Echinococcus granulosus TaxID=6210 RepID=A0A068WJG1_ECHGR|nr:hypothetical protein EgrG_000208420 [Echinococcus granulosus]